MNIEKNNVPQIDQEYVYDTIADKCVYFIDCIHEEMMEIRTIVEMGITTPHNEVTYDFLLEEYNRLVSKLLSLVYRSGQYKTKDQLEIDSYE